MSIPHTKAIDYTPRLDGSVLAGTHFFSLREQVFDVASILMAALSKSERSKAYPAAKAAILSKYTNAHDIPKWSEIGTLVRKTFRQSVISQLENTDCGDVAEYLRLHEDEIDGFLHRKIKSLRERKFGGR